MNIFVPFKYSAYSSPKYLTFSSSSTRAVAVRKNVHSIASPASSQDGDYYIASARGRDADWFKNIVANPKVHVQIRDREFDAAAEPVTDPSRIADFIELRLKRHPIMIRLIMHLFDGLPLRFNRTYLEKFCQEKAMVILHPIGMG